MAKFLRQEAPSNASLEIGTIGPRVCRLSGLLSRCWLGCRDCSRAGGWRRGIFGRLRGSRREKDPIEDGGRYRGKENDRQQGVFRGKRIQPNRIVGRSLPRGPEIGLEFRKHRAAAHRVRCEKTACFQRKLLSRQISTFSALRRGGFLSIGTAPTKIFTITRSGR